MSTQIRVLIVEDSEDDTILLVRELKRNGYDVIFEQVDNYNDMKTTLVDQEWDIVINLFKYYVITVAFQFTY